MDSSLLIGKLTGIRPLVVAFPTRATSSVDESMSRSSLQA
jgi:hypothetical protein